MTGPLHRCSTDEERIAWAVARLKDGGSIDDVSLWLAGVDRPMRIVAGVRSELRSQGIPVARVLRKVRDAAGDLHEVLTWFIGPRRPAAG